MQVIEFSWDHIKSWEIDEEGLFFAFQYCRPDKKPRLIRIQTPYVCLTKKTPFNIS